MCSQRDYCMHVCLCVGNTRNYKKKKKLQTNFNNDLTLALMFLGSPKQLCRFRPKHSVWLAMQNYWWWKPWKDKRVVCRDQCLFSASQDCCNWESDWRNCVNPPEHSRTMLSQVRSLPPPIRVCLERNESAPLKKEASAWVFRQRADQRLFAQISLTHDARPWVRNHKQTQRLWTLKAPRHKF